MHYKRIKLYKLTVKVHAYSSHVPMSSKDCTITPLVVEHTLAHPLGRIVVHYVPLDSPLSQSLQLLITGRWTEPA